MSTWQDKATIASSVALRVLTYIFLRWIPGHVRDLILFITPEADTHTI